jgi:DNA (cytosine-5)-methyltransferase 1
MAKTLKFIDLFAGLGGTRVGFEQACMEKGIKPRCVFTSEIKSSAVDIYKHNFSNEEVTGDITQVNEEDIPDFDYLLGGFPCQAFSTAGKKHGFMDTRGTLFFDVARIIKHKKPKGFLLENVEGLVTHDRKVKTSPIGNTLQVILDVLEDLGYHVCWKVLNAKNFGVPQERKRIYIAGSLNGEFNLDGFEISNATFDSIKESGLPPLETPFTEKLIELSPNIQNLSGKSIKDKRGGKNNIHSWDLELKGKLNTTQKEIMSILLRERRKKQWAEIKGIVWMDGMSLTLGEIHSFYNFMDITELKTELDDLVEKKYLRFEHPKDLVEINGVKKREYAAHLEKGYNIVTGKLSFELNKVLGDKAIAPTIVATEADRIGVIDGSHIRRMSERECLRFFGFPETYESNISHKDLYDLIGNTVVVPVIKEVSKKILNAS